MTGLLRVEKYPVDVRERRKDRKSHRLPRGSRGICSSENALLASNRPACRQKLRSLNCRMACGAWRSKSQSCMVRTGVAHLRGTAALAHAFVRFLPGGKCGFRLAPMGDGGLITPMQKMRHGPAVGTRRHELTHTLRTIPGCHRPECPTAVVQERAVLKSRRLLYLAHRAERVNKKARYETKGPDPQTGKADENHYHLTTPAILLPGSVYPANGCISGGGKGRHGNRTVRKPD
jgi:hypothetical protein